MSKSIYDKLGLLKDSKGNVSVNPPKNVFLPPWGAGRNGPYQGHSTNKTKKKKRG